jgi:hypothetical protein
LVTGSERGSDCRLSRRRSEEFLVIRLERRLGYRIGAQDQIAGSVAGDQRNSWVIGLECRSWLQDRSSSSVTAECRLGYRIRTYIDGIKAQAYTSAGFSNHPHEGFHGRQNATA